jgi:hypothetical protein
MQLSIHKIYDIANLANPKTDYHPPSAVVAAAGSAGATASADQSWLAVLSADQSMAVMSARLILSRKLTYRHQWAER